MSEAERTIDAVSWGEWRMRSGTAEGIGAALRELLATESPAAAEQAYWKLENEVVAQGSVYDAADPVVRVLVQALGEERPAHVRVAILGLLYEIVAGYPAVPGNDELIHRCRATCRDAVWVLVRELASGHHDAALDILSLLSGATSGYAGSPRARHD